jgi:hypothetical protein
MNLSKAQIEQIGKEIRKQLERLGEDKRDELKKAARDAFYKTANGKALLKLRAELNCPSMGNDYIHKLEENAVVKYPKPFGYMSAYDAERAVAVASMDAHTGQDVIDTVIGQFVKGLKPEVRRRFGLTIK